MLAGGTLYSSCEPCLLCSFVITQVAFKRVVFAARGTDVPTYKPLLGADLSEAAAWVNTQAGWARLEGGRLHAEPCLADDRGIPLGDGASQSRRGPR
jgi:tRNA(Arg) A34 adenosine deaminase TadA